VASFVSGLIAFQVLNVGNLAGKIAFWLFAIVTLLIPVAGIGVYEGGYNHGLKDVLYFSGASAELVVLIPFNTQVKEGGRVIATNAIHTPPCP